MASSRVAGDLKGGLIVIAENGTEARLFDGSGSQRSSITKCRGTVTGVAVLNSGNVVLSYRDISQGVIYANVYDSTLETY